MISRSTFLHLRIPFSFFLLPVFLFALSLSTDIECQAAWLAFFIIHFLLYPASNGYNSYFDKDEGSIGGLKNPPQVKKQLYYTALIMDFAALVLGLLISIEFSFMLLIYGLVSKAYSHPSIRLKKYPFISFFIAGFFQGFFTFIMTSMALNNMGFDVFAKQTALIPALLSSMLLWGSYPMTQVYQHSEDSKRGDRTLSILLGIKGTFLFTAVVFSITNACFIIFYLNNYNLRSAILFQLFLLPVLTFFIRWSLKVIKDQTKADFTNTMRLNFITAACMNAFFLLFKLI